MTEEGYDIWKPLEKGETNRNRAASRREGAEKLGRWAGSPTCSNWRDAEDGGERKGAIASSHQAREFKL